MTHRNGKVGLARTAFAIVAAVSLVLSQAGSSLAGVPFRVVTPGGVEVSELPAGSTVTGVERGDGESSSQFLQTGVVESDAAERVIVELRGAPIARRAKARSAAAAAAASAVIAAEQGRVLAEIDRLEGGAAPAAAGGGVGGPVRRTYQTAFNGMAASLSEATQRALRTHPDVKAIHRDAEVKAILDTSVAWVGAPTFWADHGGYRGAGRVIAVIDTGIDYTHPDLGGCGAVGGGCKVLGGYDFHNGDADPVDDNGHGTHVAATAAGNGSLLGVAPDASLLAYKVLGSNGSGYTSDVIAGIERAMDPNGDLDTSDHADVINMSLGGPGDPDDPGSQAADAATAVGVLVVAAAGNSGGYMTIGSPGTARTALTVGAVDESSQLAYFTSGGPTAGSFELKPEIAAPGVAICAARAAGTQLGATCIDATHIEISGTSMATPHVAGAAALLRGIYPSLSPGDVKSLLVQNAEPFWADALKAGAGTLDLQRSAAARTVVAPQALSFGRDDLAQAVWTTSRTLTVRNIDSVSRSYSLSAVPFYWGLPSGVAVSFSPASFVLSPGQSTTVDVGLSVDNAVVPDQESPPNAYEAMIELRSGADTQRIPMIFLKTSLLRVHTDQIASLIFVHDRTYAYRARAVAPTGTTVDILVPAGTYDVMAVFPNGLGAYVVHEGVVVANQRDEVMNATEAVHTISLTGTDELGAPLTEQFRSYTVYHRASNLGLATLSAAGGPSFGQPFAITTSTISADYDVDLALKAEVGATSYFVTRGRAGVAASHALGNAPADLTRGEVRHTPDPGEVVQSATEWFQVMASQFGGFGFGRSRSGPDHDLYVTTAPHEGSRNFVDTDVYATPRSHAGPLLHGGTAPGVIQAFNWFRADQPVYETTTGELPINLGPASFFARSVSNPAWFDLDFVAGSWTWSFHSQGGDGPQAPGGVVGWRLLSGGAPIASGALPQSGFGGPFLPFVNPVAPGPYVFETDPLPYFVGGLGATVRVRATLDTSSWSEDSNPPYLAALRVRSAGRLTDVVPSGGTAVVSIEVHDDADEAGTTLSLYRASGAGESPVVLSALGGGRYEAVMSDACNTAGPVNLVVVATDSRGNELREWLNPAFVCRPATCGNGTLEPGEACDDGNTVSGDGCNSVCSSTEQCGDGVLDAGEACDDGNTAAGDCCSATCQPEAAASNCDGDGLFCNGGGACDGAGACIPTATDPCAGGPECASTCNEATDTCLAPAGAACSDDGNADQSSNVAESTAPAACIGPSTGSRWRRGGRCTSAAERSQIRQRRHFDLRENAVERIG